MSPKVDYRCHSCNNQFEVGIKAHILKTQKIPCPQCGATNTSRVFTANPVHFKAGGFSRKSIT